MAVLPWFRLFPADWLASPTVETMSIAQEGAYFRLLCYAWRSEDGMLPNDPEKLARYAKWVGQGFEAVLTMFQPAKKAPHRLYNPRLYTEWQASQRTTEEKRQGAIKRWTDYRTQKAKRRTKPAPLDNGHAPQPLPQDFVPTDQHAKLCTARGLELNIEVNHFKGKALEKDWLCKDWNRKFTNWLLQEIKFRQARRAT